MSHSLKNKIQQQLAKLNAQTTFFAKHLNSSEMIAIRENEPVNTMSVIKIPIMLLAYQDAEAGKINLSQRYQIQPEDFRGGSGILQTFDLGVCVSYRDLITQMIITSDNTATDILIKTLGLERINNMLSKLEFSKTRLHKTIGEMFHREWEITDPINKKLSNREVFELGFPSDKESTTRAQMMFNDPNEWLGTTTAYEIADILEKIQNGSIVSRQYSDEMLALFQKQFYRSRLPSQIQYQVKVGNKTGDWEPIVGNDVGIIYSQSGPIIIALFVTKNYSDYFEVASTHGNIAKALLENWG